MEHRQCVDCGEVLMRSGMVGRFPKRCPKCVENHRVAYKKEWNNRPDVKTKAKEWHASPKQKALRAEYRKGYVCKHCAESFMAQSYRAFCSTKCRSDFEEATRAVAKKKKEKVCLGCGEVFVPRLAKYGKYCSRSCAFSDNATHKHRADYLTGDGKSCKVYFPTCADCGSTFTSNRPNARLCSDECKNADANKKTLERNTSKYVEKQLTCPECRKIVITQYGDKKQKFCSRECSLRHGRRINKGKRKARTHGVGSERIDPLLVFDIYGWECFQCKTPTPKHLRGTHDDAAPELDHIHPLSKGGAHTYANVQLLCRKCNGEKSDTVTPIP